MIENPATASPGKVLFTAFGDLAQFAALFLLLGICLPEIVPLSPLPLPRMLAFGVIFGLMKTVARIFSGQWTTHRPIWRRVDSEQWLLPCFLAGLFIAGELSPPTVDLGEIKIKPIPNKPAQPPSLGVLLARASSSLSYALSEARAGLLLLASLICEAVLFSAKSILFKRTKSP